MEGRVHSFFLLFLHTHTLKRSQRRPFPASPVPYLDFVPCVLDWTWASGPHSWWGCNRLHTHSWVRFRFCSDISSRIVKMINIFEGRWFGWELRTLLRYPWARYRILKCSHRALWWTGDSCGDGPTFTHSNFKGSSYAWLQPGLVQCHRVNATPTRFVRLMAAGSPTHFPC